eukprot:jgi/Bigna1/79506/fgenesh1_pg.63_\
MRNIPIQQLLWWLSLALPLASSHVDRNGAPTVTGERYSKQSQQIHLRHHTLHVKKGFGMLKKHPKVMEDKKQHGHYHGNHHQHLEELMGGVDAVHLLPKHIRSESKLNLLHADAISLHSYHNHTKAAWIVTLKGPIDTRKRERLEEHCHRKIAGVLNNEGDIADAHQICSIRAYIPDNSFLIVGPITDSFHGYLHSFPETIFTTLLHPAYKAHKSLLESPAVTEEAQNDSISDDEASSNIELTAHLDSFLVHHYYGGGQKNYFVAKLKEQLIASIQTMNLMKNDHHKTTAVGDTTTLGLVLNSTMFRVIITPKARSKSMPSTHKRRTDNVSHHHHHHHHHHHEGTYNYHRLIITTPKSIGDKVVYFLMKQPMVLTVMRRKKVKLSNRFASYVAQSASPTQGTSIWDLGLRGEGQIIAVADTGIDFDNCWFRDPDREVPFDRVDHNHRKIVYYGKVGDGGDYRGGHGSHVTASLLGKALYPQDIHKQTFAEKYNGMAPEAKISFFDFSKARYKDYYKPAYENTGARLMSNSWGTDPGGYDDMSLELDTFLHDYPDFLAVMAAAIGSVFNGKIRSEQLLVSSLKGCARKIQKARYRKRIKAVVMMEESSSYDPSSGSSSCNQAEKAALAIINRMKSNISICDEGHRCALLMPCYEDCPVNKQFEIARNFSKWTDVIIFEECGTCTAQVSMTNTNTQAFEVAVLSKDVFTRAVSLVRSGGISAYITIPVLATDPRKFEGSIPLFSSKGPTSDGRIKPDILAPGDWIRSARSDGKQTSNNCGELQYMHGTSMATPVAAGNIALVRQYLVDGNRMANPSAAVIKATVINGAVPMDPDLTYRVSDKTTYVNTVPSYLQGYGHHFKITLVWTDPPASAASNRQLINNLNLLAHDINNGKAYIGNQKKYLDTRHHQHLPNSHHPTIQYDELNNVEHVRFLASNISRLLVEVEGFNIVVPKQPYALVATVMVPSSSRERDLDEEIDFYFPNDIGLKQVQIKESEDCTPPPKRGKGGDEQPDDPVATICPNQCSNRGVCLRNHKCKCYDGFVGFDCSQNATKISYWNDDFSFSRRLDYISPESWRYISFVYSENEGVSNSNPVKKKIPLDQLAVLIEFDDISQGSDPDLYIRYGQLPSLTKYDYKDWCNSIVLYSF